MEKMAYTQNEAAKVMRISVPTLRQLIYTTDFPAIKMGKRWVIPVSALRRWMDDMATNRSELELTEGKEEEA